MALLDELAERLSSQSVASSCGAGGWLLWKGHMPDSTGLQDKAVALIETGGLEPHARAELDRPTFQVVVRGGKINSVSTGYEEARAKVEGVKTALHAYTGTPLSTGHYWPGIWAEQEPFFVGFDSHWRPTFSINFRGMRSRTT